MKYPFRYHLSIGLNVLLLGFNLLMGFIYRDKLYQYVVREGGQHQIVMYGNSITAQGKWVELLARTDVLNASLPGQTTYHFLQAVQERVIDKKPKICFVMGGINDITIGVSPQNLQKNYKELLEALMRAGITPIVSLTLYEQNDANSKRQVDLLNQFLISYCQQEGIQYLNPNEYLSDSTGLKAAYAVDKTHLNERAYRLWAAEIREVLHQNKL
ncbi:lysophospholipase L1-like esterase [Dyadobacter jejuensis]|uniref:Lysophospholipase L1-like esterase n=1 Tax=Dyadobacter jejuensis TaxID=1082580 RepID=A0A316AJ02_9BACT|nr:GDSL-type esterase/lipase family protein [Dyadobacter jejuensis]PWJ57562.1 lysophospholipase L1-like esterase [Dyadobacter jejuensis]